MFFTNDTIDNYQQFVRMADRNLNFLADHPEQDTGQRREWLRLRGEAIEEIKRLRHQWPTQAEAAEMRDAFGGCA